MPECLCDVQIVELHLSGGGPQTAALRLHQGSQEAGARSATALHHLGGEVSWGKMEGKKCDPSHRNED